MKGDITITRADSGDLQAISGIEELLKKLPSKPEQAGDLLRNRVESGGD
jgi:hypothetical protein